MSYNKKVICNILKNFDCYVASLVLVVLVILTFFGAIWRYLLHSPFTWLEEVQTSCMVWIVFAGAGVASCYATIPLIV